MLAFNKPSYMSKVIILILLTTRISKSHCKNSEPTYPSISRTSTSRKNLDTIILATHHYDKDALSFQTTTTQHDNRSILKIRGGGSKKKRKPSKDDKEEDDPSKVNKLDDIDACISSLSLGYVSINALNTQKEGNSVLSPLYDKYPIINVLLSFLTCIFGVSSILLSSSNDMLSTILFKRCYQCTIIQLSLTSIFASIIAANYIPILGLHQTQRTRFDTGIFSSNTYASRYLYYSIYMLVYDYTTNKTLLPSFLSNTSIIKLCMLQPILSRQSINIISFLYDWCNHNHNTHPKKYNEQQTKPSTDTTTIVSQTFILFEIITGLILSMDCFMDVSQWVLSSSNNKNDVVSLSLMTIGKKVILVYLYFMYFLRKSTSN